jgi:hypothetical protein
LQSYDQSSIDVVLVTNDQVPLPDRTDNMSPTLTANLITFVIALAALVPLCLFGVVDLSDSPLVILLAAVVQ